MVFIVNAISIFPSIVIKTVNFFFTFKTVYSDYMYTYEYLHMYVHPVWA